MHVVTNDEADPRRGAQMSLPTDASPDQINRALRHIRRAVGDDAQVELIVVGSRPAN